MGKNWGTRERERERERERDAVNAVVMFEVALAEARTDGGNRGGTRKGKVDFCLIGSLLDIGNESPCDLPELFWAHEG